MKADLSERLAKLIPMLATDQPGEIVATVLAIRRALDANGMDLHDLVKCLGARPAFDPVEYAAQERRAARQRRYTHPEGFCADHGMETREGFVKSWHVVAAELLKLNRIPKRYGGQCLMDHQIKILERAREGRTITNAEASAIERMDSMLRSAERAQAAERRKKAA